MRKFRDPLRGAVPGEARAQGSEWSGHYPYAVFLKSGVTSVRIIKSVEYGAVNELCGDASSVLETATGKQKCGGPIKVTSML